MGFRFGFSIDKIQNFKSIAAILEVGSRHQNKTCGNVKPETKWMPNSDSALKLVSKCKILCQYDLLNYFLQLFENCRFLRFLYGFSI